jgi:SAM-dependent methyltransferase
VVLDRKKGGKVKLPSRSEYLTQEHKKEIIKVGEAEIEVCYARAHRYKPTSLKLISEKGLDASILDVGGGDRIINLPYFVNFDRFRYSGLVNVVGDAHHLPFKDDTFDLVLCEAVIEHLRKPWVAVEEFYRVLKFKGYIYADVAFMVSAHAYPSHYFNMTREGVRALFEKFKEVNSGVQEYQMPSYALVPMLFMYIRYLLPRLDNYIGHVEIYDNRVFVSDSRNVALSSFLALVWRLFGRVLGGLDKLIKPERAERIAAGTYFLGKKVRG